MEQQIIFLDVDGTLCNEHGVIPPSAIEAIQQARSNGHLVYLCTGRAKAEIYDFILDIGFDGMILSSGAYIIINDTVLFDRHLSKEEVIDIVEFFDSHDIHYYLESNNGLYASEGGLKVLHEFVESLIEESPHKKDQIMQGMGSFVNSMLPLKDSTLEDINKISILSNSYGFDNLIKKYPQYDMIPNTVAEFGENSGELSIPGITKGSAIQLVLEHLKIDPKNTFGYGDSYNDHEMIEVVAHGIAMGNATEALKEIADDITDTHNNDGIYKSFKKYNLI